MDGGRPSGEEEPCYSPWRQRNDCVERKQELIVQVSPQVRLVIVPSCQV